MSLDKCTQRKVVRSLGGVVSCNRPPDADRFTSFATGGIVNLELPEIFRKDPHLLLDQLQWWVTNILWTRLKPRGWWVRLAETKYKAAPCHPNDSYTLGFHSSVHIQHIKIMMYLLSAQLAQLFFVHPLLLHLPSHSEYRSWTHLPMALAISPSETQYQLAHIHDNRSGEIITAGAICLSVAFAAVILRLISRRFSRAGSMQLDDYMIISALVSLIFLDEQFHCALTFCSCWHIRLPQRWLKLERL